VLEALCQAWPAAQTARGRATLQAWLGPCIGPRAFEVGPEVRAAFVLHDTAAASAFVPVPDHPDGVLRYLCDLAALARRRLQALGLVHIHGNDGSADWCTVTQASVFFSHRRDSRRFGSSGRQAACIWRRA
jgi:polyphenol oxidase